MRGYFLVLLIASAIGAVVGIIADGKYEKQVRYLISLICVIIILAPMKEAVEVFKEYEVGTVSVGTSATEADRWIIDRSVAELEHTLSEAALYRFGIEVADVTILTVVGDGLTSVERVQFSLFPTQSEHSEELKSYFEKLLYVDVEVIILEE